MDRCSGGTQRGKLGRPGVQSKGVSEVKAQARENEERIEVLTDAMDSSVDVMIIYDLEGSAKYVSESFTRMFGWT